MRVHKKVAAAAVAASLGAGLVVPIQAGAVIEQTRPFSVDAKTGAFEGFQTVEANKGRVSWLTYNNPTYGSLPTALYIDAFNDGTRVQYVGNDTDVKTSSKDGVDTITLTHTKNGVELTRTFTVTAKEVTVNVVARNVTDAPSPLAIDLTAGMMSYDYELTATPKNNGYEVSVGGRYNVHTLFDDPTTTATGDTLNNALAGANNASRFQTGKWENTVAPGETLEATVTFQGTASEALKDTDGDGFPDEWERNGFTSADGKEFPLHRWGADPTRPDLFLQLNWMKSEWESLGCSDKRKYAPTEEDFDKFQECANANTNVYRPSRQTLNDLVDLFDKEGYNLHIDAGVYYNNIPGLEPHGGPTEDYAEYYFAGENPAVRMIKDRDRLLGERKNIFRVGVIGDSQAADNPSSGNALLADGAFYIAKNERMTSQEQLRNTILHEFGHNLGLTHSGSSKVKRPDSEYVPHYESVMNYLYQFSVFNYSKETATPDSTKPLPAKCTDGSVECFKGDYSIAPDWNNLDLVNGEIRKATGTSGVADEDPDESGHTHPSVSQLVALSAERNNGKAGLRMLSLKDNPSYIVANRYDSRVNVELSNLGIDLHKFTLQVNYPGGDFRREYPVEGALTEYAALPIEVPITNTIGYDEAEMPIQFRVFNEEGLLVEDQTVNFSVLNYSAKDMQDLIADLEKTNPEKADQVRDILAKPDPSKPTLTQAPPIPTATNLPVLPGQRHPAITSLGPKPTTPRPTKPSKTVYTTPGPTVTKPTSTVEPQASGSSGSSGGSGSGSSSSPGAIVGIIIAVLAVLGLGGAAAAYMNR